MSTKPTDEPAAPTTAAAAPPEPPVTMGGDPPSPPAQPATAHRIDQLTAVLLLTAAGTALAAAGPSLLRAAGAPLPSAQPTVPTVPLDLRHQPPEILSNPDPLFDPDHDTDADDPGIAGLRGHPAADPQTGEHAKPGLARGALALRDRPADAGRAVGEVKAGELVMIVREAGDWALVWAGGSDGIVMGWARKSGIAVR